MEKKILPLFIFFQAITVSTKLLFDETLDQIGIIINLIFIGCFFVFLFKRAKIGWPLLLSGIILLLQLWIPAVLSFLGGGAVSLMSSSAKITTIMMVLFFSISYHHSAKTIVETIKCLKVCALFFILTVIFFQVFRIGETCYGARIFYLGYVQSESVLSLSLFSLILPFFFRSGKLDFFVLIIVLVMVSLLFKRSVLLCTLITFIFGLKYTYIAKTFEIKLIIGISSFLFILFFGSELLNKVSDHELVKLRFRDFERAEKDQSKYGSGRVGLLQSHLRAFSERDYSSKLFGVIITGKVSDGRYLDGKLRKAPHNDLLEFLNRAGILGLATFLGFCFFLVIELRKSWSSQYFRSHSFKFLGKAAGFSYLIHIFAGVLFNLLFMSIIAILLGISIAASSLRELKTDIKKEGKM